MEILYHFPRQLGTERLKKPEGHRLLREAEEERRVLVEAAAALPAEAVEFRGTLPVAIPQESFTDDFADGHRANFGHVAWPLGVGHRAGKGDQSAR
jgi:hypothetical protein